MNKLEVIAEPGKQELFLKRTFNAPRDLVFKTWLDPKAIPEWWGPRKDATIVDQMDVRPGGTWRFISRDAEGNEFGFHGVYHEITPGERIVQTFEFEGWPGHVALETATFEEVDRKTKFTGQSVFQSVEDRDGMVSSGMEEGAAETMDRLAEIVEKARVS